MTTVESSFAASTSHFDADHVDVPLHSNASSQYSYTSDQHNMNGHVSTSRGLISPSQMCVPAKKVNHQPLVEYNLDSDGDDDEVDHLLVTLQNQASKSETSSLSSTTKKSSSPPNKSKGEGGKMDSLDDVPSAVVASRTPRNLVSSPDAVSAVSQAAVSAKTADQQHRNRNRLIDSGSVPLRPVNAGTGSGAVFRADQGRQHLLDQDMAFSDDDVSEDDLDLIPPTAFQNTNRESLCSRVHSYCSVM